MFGTDPFGAAPFGMSLPTTTEARQAYVPQALKFDGSTLDFELDDRGHYVGAHPIDTKVFHRLRIRGNSMRSAPGTGNGVPNHSYIDPLTIEAQVKDDVRLALLDMVEAKEIEDRGIELDLSVRGRVAYVYRYVNLHTGKPGSFRA